MAKQYFETACPSCGSSRVISHGKRNAFYPLGCLAVVGLPFAMIHQASSPIDYECQTCRQRFAQRSPMARFTPAVLILGVLNLVAIAILVAWRQSH